MKVEVNSIYGLCGRRATLKCRSISELRNCVKVEEAVLGFPVSNTNGPYGLCGRQQY